MTSMLQGLQPVDLIMARTEDWRSRPGPRMKSWRPKPEPSA